MGHVISANCECGYSVTDVPIGGGRANFTRVCMHPALCRSGSHLVNVNLKDTDLQCPDGHDGTPLPYYSTPSLSAGSRGEVVSEWQGRAITEDVYECPQCGEFKLTFSHPHLFFD